MNPRLDDGVRGAVWLAASLLAVHQLALHAQTEITVLFNTGLAVVSVVIGLYYLRERRQ